MIDSTLSGKLCFHHSLGMVIKVSFLFTLQKSVSSLETGAIGAANVLQRFLAQALAKESDCFLLFCKDLAGGECQRLSLINQTREDELFFSSKFL